MVARQGGRDRIIGRKSPTCAQNQWTSRIEILSVSLRPIRASSYSSSHPHSCSGITSILTARPYCGRCAVSACGLAAAIPADVLDPILHAHLLSQNCLERPSLLPTGSTAGSKMCFSSFLLPSTRAALPPHPILSAIPPSRP
ncbi:hypothetical protein GGI43DRAFT_251734 [Trichoderma evansii]